ncbi:MAG: prepilin-type N-terminal cleavage/methylation domain-containing protein [Deltaproteobacteria bacterium]|nr:prepilin-type N-terminal cleavage/methylation domain-containing protein [Deltaproteobacteria bacterium]
MKKTAGFTLIELLLAIFILTVVVTTIYAAFSGTFRIVKDSEYSGNVYAMARIAMDRLTRDMEGICNYGGNPEFVSRFSDSGDMDSVEVSFRSNTHVSFDENSIAESLLTIVYRLEKDEETDTFVLLREEVLKIRDDINTDDRQKTGFVLCDRIQAVDYKFYDSKGNEYDYWNSSAGPAIQKGKVPTVVYICFYIVNPEDEEQPYTFATKIFIPLSQGAS